MSELLTVQQTIADPVERAIERLRAFAPAEGYWLAFSGGKDSQCIYHLAQEAGVRFEAHYNATTVDPPELVRFIKREYPDVAIDKPALNMRQLIVREGVPPTRRMRYCCRFLKERGGAGHLVVTGVRWAESTSRQNKRQMNEVCTAEHKRVLNPIIDWSDRQVWQFIQSRQLPYCSLYDEGFTRLGCVGCPMGNRPQQLRQFARWPHYERLYLRTFADMLDHRRERGLVTQWHTAQEVMDWWTSAPEYPMFGDTND